MHGWLTSFSLLGISDIDDQIVFILCYLSFFFWVHKLKLPSYTADEVPGLQYVHPSHKAHRIFPSDL